MTAAEERVAALIAAGRHRDAVAAGEELVAEEPLREQGWTHLMLARHRDGRQADALEAYRRLRSVLAAALGVEPGPRTRELHAAVLHQDPALDLAARPSLGGTHDDLRELIALTAAGAVRLHTRSHPLDAFADAIADLENGRMHGRGVLVP